MIHMRKEINMLRLYVTVNIAWLHVTQTYMQTGMHISSLLKVYCVWLKMYTDSCKSNPCHSSLMTHYKFVVMYRSLCSLPAFSFLLLIAHSCPICCGLEVSGLQPLGSGCSLHCSQHVPKKEATKIVDTALKEPRIQREAMRRKLDGEDGNEEQYRFPVLA